ncbi:MAG: phosphatase domain-containing protein [Hymenobacter sp.]
MAALPVAGPARRPDPDQPNAFFYVSSSEWNLYDFLREFTDHHQLPKGVYQLSQLKRLGQLLSGQNKHATSSTASCASWRPAPAVVGLLGDDSTTPVFTRR